MKQLIIIILFFSSPMLLASHSKDSEKKCCDKHNEYKITIVNLTKGQPITPPLVAVHTQDSQIFHLGQEASSGLKELSQDGGTSKLRNELRANSKSFASKKEKVLFYLDKKQKLKFEL